MTHEATGQSQPFANSYPMPENQLEFEMTLLDDFANQFPDSKPVLGEALADVQRYSGIKIPKYKLVEPLSEGAEADPGLVDEMGFLDANVGDSGYSMLMLTMPVQHTEEQIKAMSVEERTEASATHNGFLVLGEVPPETTAMLNGVYGLIGAETIRDDRSAGENDGTVLRLGVYQGEPIYVAEDYSDSSPYYNGKPTMTVRIVGKNAGEKLAEELTQSQFREFSEIVGNPASARELIFSNNVTRDNYRQIAELMQQTKDIVDSAGNERHNAQSR
jgi:hypothetical protein